MVKTIKMDLVSIIIPVFNREKEIRRSIESALNQTYSCIEIIVCDNASTDKTWDVITEYLQKDSRIKAFKNEENIGPVLNWVECLKHVTGDYIKILWSDDTISSNYISKTLPILQNNPDVGFVYSKVNMLSPDGKVVKESYRLGETGQYKSSLFIKSSLFGKKEIPVSPGCALFRKKDVEANLCIDIPNPYSLVFRRYGAGNDLLIFLRTCKDYKHFYFIDESLSSFYGGEDSLTVSNNLEIYYMYAKYTFVSNNVNLLLKTRYYAAILRGKYSCFIKDNPPSCCVWRFLASIFGGK